MGRRELSAQQVLTQNLKQVIGAVHGCVVATGGPGPCPDCCEHAERVMHDVGNRPRPRPYKVHS